MKIDALRFCFLRDLLSDFAKEIEHKFLEGPKSFRQAPPAVIAKLLDDLALTLDPILLPTVVAYIFNKKQQHPEVAGVYHALFKNSTADTLHTLESFHSPTMEIIYRRIYRFKKHFTTVIDRVFHDWGRLINFFDLKESMSLKKIQLTCGDEHADGAQTSIFLFGETPMGFVYKPIDVNIDLLMTTLMGSFEHELGYTDYQKIRVLPQQRDNSHYGYVEYRAYTGDVERAEDAKKIFRSFGRLLAYGKAFKIADGHCDNIMVHAPYVYWIDLETSFHTFSSTVQTVHDLEKTGLLLEAKPSNVYIGLVTGLQGGIVSRLSLTQPHACKDGTDDIHIRFFKVLEATASYTNHVSIQGHRCAPENFSVEIKAGYHEAYAFICINKRNIIEKALTFLQRHKVYTRHLFLVTACYARYIRLLQHIEGIRSEKILSTIREERESVLSEKELLFKSFIIENELMDLCRGVIPYFFRSSHSTSIYHPSGSEAQHFFGTLLSNALETHIAQLDETELASDLQFIDAALLSTAGLDSWESFTRRFEFKTYNPSTQKVAPSALECQH